MSIFENLILSHTSSFISIYLYLFIHTIWFVCSVLLTNHTKLSHKKLFHGMFYKNCDKANIHILSIGYLHFSCYNKYNTDIQIGHIGQIGQIGQL